MTFLSLWGFPLDGRLSSGGSLAHNMREGLFLQLRCVVLEHRQHLQDEVTDENEGIVNQEGMKTPTKENVRH